MVSDRVKHMAITFEFFSGFGLGFEYIEKMASDKDFDESVLVITIGFGRIVLWLND